MRNYFKEQKKNYEKCTGKVKIKNIKIGIFKIIL